MSRISSKNCNLQNYTCSTMKFDLIKSSFLYRQIQTLDKILLYEAPGDVPHDMKYKATFKINKNIECSSMIVTSSYIITCQDKRLHCYNFSGDEIRVWFVLFSDCFVCIKCFFFSFRQMDSPIRYLKLIGGPPEHEAVLIGLKNGGVYQVYPFPQFIAKQSGVIFCVDMNINRTKIAIIDDSLTLFVYDVRTKELLYQVDKRKKNNNNHRVERFLFCRSQMLKQLHGTVHFLICSHFQATVLLI